MEERGIEMSSLKKVAKERGKEDVWEKEKYR
jgi:hypothetical protein